jgi:ABC-type multidrug transport system ATPase subunit
MHGRTTFIIAHRISSVKRADLVLVIENGRIAQRGTHNQLMAEGGHYRDIAVAQLRMDDETDDQQSGPTQASHMDRAKNTDLVDAITHAAIEKEEKESQAL